METKQIAISQPVDLIQDADIVGGRVLAETSLFVFVQNTSTVDLRWRETVASPALSDPGHALPAGAAIVALLSPVSFWLWAPAGTGGATVSDGSPTPTREA